MSKEASWLDYTDAEYDRMIHKWNYTWEVFTGEYSDRENVKKYLIKRAYWEKSDAYDLRIVGADPDMLFSVLVGSIVGQLFAVEGDEKRIWQADGVDGLGDPNDPDTIMGRLWDNADGEGTSWPVLWRQFATQQMLFQSMYVLVEGIDMQDRTGDDGQPTGEFVQVGEARVKLIDPRMVLAKGYDGGRLSWVKVKHVVSVGDDDPRQKHGTEEQYTVYQIGGWERYRKVKSGDQMAEELIADGSYDFYETNDMMAQCLPVLHVRFPFPAYVAHYLARKAIAIFNLDSARDTYLGEATVTHLIESGDPMAFESHRTDMSAGETHHQFAPGTDAKYIAPPSDPAELASEVLKDKRETLFISAYQQYGNAAAETTATAIRQQARAGIEAFLSLFSSTVEEAQNRATFLLEQVYFPTEPDKWGGAKVELSRQFVPADPDAQDQILRETFFGPDAVPVDAETLLSAAVRMIERRGFEVQEAQRESLRAIFDAYVSKRDGLRPRAGEATSRLQELALSLNGGAAN